MSKKVVAIGRQNGVERGPSFLANELEYFNEKQGTPPKSSTTSRTRTQDGR